MNAEFVTEWFWQWAQRAKAAGDHAFAVTLLNQHQDLVRFCQRLEDEGLDWDSEKYDRVLIQRIVVTTMKGVDP